MFTKISFSEVFENQENCFFIEKTDFSLEMNWKWRRDVVVITYIAFETKNDTFMFNDFIEFDTYANTIYNFTITSLQNKKLSLLHILSLFFFNIPNQLTFPPPEGNEFEQQVYDEDAYYAEDDYEYEPDLEPIVENDNINTNNRWGYIWMSFSKKLWDFSTTSTRVTFRTVFDFFEIYSAPSAIARLRL